LSAYNLFYELTQYKFSLLFQGVGAILASWQVLVAQCARVGGADLWGVDPKNSERSKFMLWAVGDDLKLHGDGGWQRSDLDRGAGRADLAEEFAVGLIKGGEVFFHVG
jgi:hypothetical protein